jgi:hypothetical protein
MRRFLLLAALALGAAQTASAQDDVAVALDTGQAATLRIDPAGAVTVADGGAAALSAYDRRALELTTGLTLEEASGPNAVAFNAEQHGMAAPPIAPGAVRILFARLDNGQSLLVLENGYDQALVYRARIHIGGRSVPTDVCTALPGLRGYEHWPDRIDRIELTGVRLEPWPEGQRPRCE